MEEGKETWTLSKGWGWQAAHAIRWQKGTFGMLGGDPLSAHGTGELQGTFWSMRGSHGNVGDSEGTLHLFAEVWKAVAGAEPQPSTPVGFLLWNLRNSGA